MCDRKPTNQDASDDEFVACTGVAGVTPGTALNTTPPFVLWNPGNSLYYVDLQSVIASYLSGTLGAGALVLGLSKQGGDPGGTILVPVNRLSSGALPPQCAVARTGATLEQTPTIVQPVAQVGAFAGATQWSVDPEIDRPVRLTLAPGWALSLAEIGAAGAAPVMLLGMAFQIRKIKA